MESLPREILQEITNRLSLSGAASLAQTCKSFNNSIWSLITTIEDSSKNLDESTVLDKFNNLESLSFRFDATVIPQDLTKLTTLQKLQINVVDSIDIKTLAALKNLQELVVLYKDGSSVNLDDLLTDHTRLTKLGILADNMQQLDLFSWKIMSRLHSLNLFANCTAYYDDSSKLSAGFLSTLWTLTQLRSLGLSGLFLDQFKIETGLSKLTNLEELDLDQCTLRIELDGEWVFDYNELLDLKKLTRLGIMEMNMNKPFVDIVANMTQLVMLDVYEPNSEHQLGTFSTCLKNLTRICLSVELSESYPGLEFSQMPNIEHLATLWSPNITQLVHLKKLRKLDLHKSANHHTNEQSLNFLNELGTLEELTLSAALLPSNGIVDMKGMTNLMHVKVDMPIYDAESVAPSVANFVQGLSSLPNLASLHINGEITQELLQTMATSLTQLGTLKLSKVGRSLFREAASEVESGLPSYKDFNFKIEFTQY